MPLSLYTNLPVTAELLPRLLLSWERPQAQSSFPKNRSQRASSVRPTAAAAAAQFITATTCRKSICESHSRRLDKGATRIVSGARSADNVSSRVLRAAKHGQHPLLAYRRGGGHLLSRPRAYFSTSDAPKQPSDEEDETQPRAPTGSSHDSDSALKKRELLWDASINPNALHRTDPERKVIQKYFNSLTLYMKKLGELRALESIRVSVSRPDVTGIAGSDNPDTFVGRREVYEWKTPIPGQPRTRIEKWEKQIYNGAVKRLKSLGFRISASQTRSTGNADMEGNEDTYESAGFRLEKLTERPNVLAEERISTDADTKTSVLNDEGPTGSQELSRKANAEGQRIAGQEEPAVLRIETVWDKLMRQSEKLMAIGVKDQNLGSKQEEPTEVKDSAAQKRTSNLSEPVNDAPTFRQMERAEAEKQRLSRPSPNGTPRPTMHTIHEIFSRAPFARKSQQSSLPPYEYWERDEDIQVVYVRDHRHADTELQRTFYPATENRLSRIVGFDAEWRPSWRDNFPENAVSLVQLARGKRILLLQISAMRTFPKKLIEFLDDETFIKAGVDIQSDAQRLYRDYAVITRSCVELSHLARAVDRDRWPGDMRQLISLARLVQSYKGRLLTKGSVRTSNWEDDLTESQQRYAANDAHAGLMVATSLLKRGNHIDRSLFMFDIVRANAVHADSQFWRATRSPSGFPAPAVKKKSQPSAAAAAYSELLSSFHVPDTEDVSRRGTKAKTKTNATDLISMLRRHTQRDASQNI